MILVQDHSYSPNEQNEPNEPNEQQNEVLMTVEKISLFVDVQ
jgi:hypothetical protein